MPTLEQRNPAYSFLRSWYDGPREQRYLLVLPVLFYEFLALALVRGLLPNMMLQFWAGWTYAVIGIIETMKGCLAFVACPMFGRLSDIIGRQRCLLLTVMGTTFPVCTLALTQNLWVFAAALSFSGIFAATFPLTFAYIADFVPREDRAPAYGLALATFGLSFSLGPVIGSYLAKDFGNQAVFMSSVLLSALDVAYIIFILPESRDADIPTAPSQLSGSDVQKDQVRQVRIPKILRRGTPWYNETADPNGNDYLPFQWNPLESIRAFSGNPLLSRVALIVFLYYTSVWAVVSTLMVYVVRQFSFGPVMVGQLLSAFGVCTMLAEGVLVRVLVPKLGEKMTLQIGLLGFATQCIFIGLAHSRWMIFASMGGSLLSNLVYPSISSLVSRSVAVSAQGEVLGTINGVRALTEGFGPLLFGFLLSRSEGTFLPGFPYLIAAAVCVAALVYSSELPDNCSDDLVMGTYGIDEHGHDPAEMQGLLESDTDHSHG
ncbi:unnamed protein product [Discosporangium mesarthrocarpum]